MKFLIISGIHIYWFLVPKKHRNRCIFKTTCSKHVYEITKQKGFYNGVTALKFRINNCNNDFDIYTNFKSGKREAILHSGLIIDANLLSDNLIPHNQNY